MTDDAGLLRRYDARRLLEVGCGEGVLLAALAGSDLYGTELSTKALDAPEQMCRRTSASR